MTHEVCLFDVTFKHFFEFRIYRHTYFFFKVEAHQNRFAFAFDFVAYSEKILIAQIRSIEDETIANIKELIQLFDEQNNEQIVRQMKKIVPEFISNNSVFSNLDTKH